VPIIINIVFAPVPPADRLRHEFEMKMTLYRDAR
jgi:hypothetical protein